MEGILTPVYATYANILPSHRSTRPHDLTSAQCECSPTAQIRRSEFWTLNFGTPFEPRYIFGAEKLDQ